jgi:phosphohistidine phosphatase
VPSLHLLRHAKSAWDAPDLPDRDRPLAPRGRRAAAAMAAHLAGIPDPPTLVLCSPAVRARQTLDAVLARLAEPPSVEFEERLYGAGCEALLERLREVANGERSVLVVGHNPGLHELALQLIGGAVPDEFARLRSGYPTGALASFQLDVPQWREVSTGAARLLAFTVPRELGTR